MSDLYDVVVVGGGPAGSAAALRARQLRADAQVLLLDAADFPRDKACGDGIAPHAADELAMLGALDALDGYPPVRRLRVSSPGGREVLAEPRRPNYVVPREVFDARLVAAAVRAGVTVRRGRVRRLTVRDGWVELDGEVAGRVVVGADGASSTVRRQLEVARTPPAHTAIAVRGYAPAPAGVPEQRIAMVAQGWPAYAWSFPIGDGRANVGFGKLTTRIGEEGRGGRAELYDRLAELLPDSPADPATLRAHHLPLSSGRPRQPDGRVLLAGDALSLINPLTGEGIYYALLSGRLAAEAAIRAPDAAGTAYRQALGRELGRHLRHTTLLARAGQVPGFLDAAVAAADRRRDVFDVAVEVGLGRGTVPLGLLATVGRGWLASRLSRPRS
jgi:geranylgeranyl reductase family protein